MIRFKNTRNTLSLLAMLFVVAACGGSSVTSTATPVNDSPGLATPDAVAPVAPVEALSVADVVIETSAGNIGIQLNPDSAPLTVDNFLNYVDGSFYDGTVFHRVIDGFMIQGGGFTDTFELKQTLDPVANEADNTPGNTKYTIAMARTSDPQSATAQFFINVVDNPFLDYTAPTIEGWGYTVFGEVVSGQVVVDQIASSTTTAAGPFISDVPSPLVLINRIRREK